MYKIVVALYECDESGNLIKAAPILEHTSSPERSIQEAYEFFDPKILFEIFLQVDEAIEQVIDRGMVASQMREPDFEQQRGISAPVDLNPSRE